MPFKSEAQRKAMYAAASGKSNIGIPKKVAEKFVSESHGQGKLPARAPKRKIDHLRSGEYKGKR